MKVYLLWYDNGVDFNELLAIYATREDAERALANAPGSLNGLVKFGNDYSYLRPNDCYLVIEEFEVQ